MVLDDYTCVLCTSGHEETLYHLFFTCLFSICCWNWLGVSWDLSLSTVDLIIDAHQKFGSKIFMEISMVACWCIWLHRNGIIFDGAALSLDRWKMGFKEELSLIMHRAKPSLKQELNIWLCNLT
ncbi:hypothetical protein SETIT_3G356100v2 [Setaria italica]|uniref:Reverse transcriptase zinc-binding domain-containing protein n=1 Tax=Setaria italica TaxID=4555 RepID=A0A368QM88_SETIT|nr:hypothetical protein SETIT_3G356100v2 [Setaria italica]